MPEVDLVQWSESWLKTAGCAKVSVDYESDAAGVITKFTVKQEVYNSANTPSNRLRIQKFNIAALNAEMEVVKVVTCMTSDELELTSVPELVGTQKAHAYLINHGAHGYAKFVLDERTVAALETGLHKIKSSLDRNQLYNILYDMTISGQIPGARVLEIVKNNIKFAE